MPLGLGAKFTLTVLIIMVCTMAANALFFLHSSTRFHEQQLVERGRALGRLISVLSPEAILGFDFLLLNDYTREVCSQPDVVYGVIVSRDGVAISSYVNDTDPLIKKHRPSGAPNDVLNLLQKLDARDKLVKLEFPITHNGAPLGRFLVGMSRQSLESEFRHELAVQLLVFAGIVVFLGAAIHGVFRFNVLLPIQKLIAASGEVGRGQYTRVDVKSSDELGLLARAFNAMTEEVKQEQAKLHRQANFDALTGLPNRMMALDRISLEINRAKRSGQRFAVLFIDLDDFKNVNDSLGHAVGDQLLVAMATRLQASLRDSDTCARLGGDEFLVLVPDVSDEVQLERIAERLLQTVSEPQELNERKIVIHCSIGIALYPDNGDSVEALMANADNAMYQAKVTKHSAIFFTEEMNVQLRERVQMEHDLNFAVERGQLTLLFQPIIDAASERHCGAEVLVRWQHPERGYLNPARFIPLAESTGQIVAIGDWVLEQACRCWSAWTAAGMDPGFLAINISRVQLRKRFSLRLAELMSSYGVPPRALELELTETVLLDHQVADELSDLRALGVRLSLDDFGTGYSSLSYLKRFRFDVLKIDGSFVSGLPDDPDDVLLVKAIVAMAKGLDIRVVAEGVENQGQLAFVTNIGCDFVQGFLVGKPVDEEVYHGYFKNLRAGGKPLPRPAIGSNTPEDFRVT